MRIFKTLLAGFCLALAIGKGGAVAEEIKGRPVAVVELFTSQGCSSCPPADALMEELGHRDDVLTLAYHVDYWDYIGWEDTFGDAAHSDFQRAYAQSWGKNRIYTPQLVINGLKDVVGSRRQEVETEIADAFLSVPVDLVYEEGLLAVTIPPVPGAPAAMIYLVTFQDHSEVDIERGENQGKQISYAQIVNSRHVVGVWNPVEGARLTLPLSELFGDTSNGVAILVQQHQKGLPGAILGAAMFQM